MVELTGDVTPDMRAIAQADLIVTTPEKWDGVSRSWQNRSYVQKVAILIIDEIHLLGERAHGWLTFDLFILYYYLQTYLFFWTQATSVQLYANIHKLMSSSINTQTHRQGNPC